MNIANGTAKEARAKAFELIHRICCKAMDLSQSIFVGWSGWFRAVVEKACSGFGGRFSRVDHPHSLGHGFLNQWPQQRVVRAAKNKSVRLQFVRRGIPGDLVEVNAEYFVGHGMMRPTLLNKRDQQGTGFLDGSKALSMAGGSIGMALDSGVCGDNEDISRCRCGTGCLRAWFDHAEHRNGNSVLNCIEGEGTRRVAGNYQELGALFPDQKLCALDRVASDSATRLGAIWEACGVADESKTGAGQLCDQCAENGEPAEAGIEYANCGGGTEVSVTAWFLCWA